MKILIIKNWQRTGKNLGTLFPSPLNPPDMKGTKNYTGLNVGTGHLDNLEIFLRLFCAFWAFLAFHRPLREKKRRGLNNDEIWGLWIAGLAGVVAIFFLSFFKKEMKRKGCAYTRKRFFGTQSIFKEDWCFLPYFFHDSVAWKRKREQMFFI